MADIVLAPAGAVAAASASPDTETNDVKPVNQMTEAEIMKPKILKTLPNGKTMGTAGDSDADLPDYVKVISNDGRDGWVRKEDFADPAPQSPTEAVEMMERQVLHTVPVFGDDGKTITGEWTWG